MGSEKTAENSIKVALSFPLSPSQHWQSLHFPGKKSYLKSIDRNASTVVLPYNNYSIPLILVDFNDVRGERGISKITFYHFYIPITIKKIK